MSSWASSDHQTGGGLSLLYSDGQVDSIHNLNVPDSEKAAEQSRAAKSHVPCG